MSGQQAITSQAAWDKNAGTLQMAVGSHWQRGTVVAVAFVLVNPDTAQAAPSLSVAASWGGVYSIAAAAMEADTANATDETGAAAGDAAPLKVYDPTFIVRCAAALPLIVGCRFSLTWRAVSGRRC